MGKETNKEAPVVQEEATGCGIAAVANIVGRSYSVIKKAANSRDIFAEDNRLFSDTRYMRTLLRLFGAQAADQESPFVSWNSLPPLALLAIKYREEKGRAFWHWVVFKRSSQGAHVIDSASYLKNNLRTDFGRMKPKWFIEVTNPEKAVHQRAKRVI